MVVIAQTIRTLASGAEGLFQLFLRHQWIAENLQTSIYTECKLFIGVIFNQLNSVNRLIHEQKDLDSKEDLKACLLRGAKLNSTLYHCIYMVTKISRNV